MPINTDIRQAVILALESQGADVGTAVRDVLRDIAREQDVLTKEWEESGISVEQLIAQMAKLNAESRKYNDILTEVNRGSGGDDKRDRIDALAREERQLEALNAELAENQRAREKEAAAAQFVTRQTADLSDALRGLAESEREASTYSFFADAGRNAIGKTAGEMGALHEAILANSRATQVASGGFLGMVNTLNPFGKSTREAATSQADLARHLDASGRASRNSGFGFLAFSHAMQDAQYGTAAVLNNIPLVVQGMGGSAGLAGAVMLAGVGFEVLKPKMEDFGRKLNILRDPLRDLQGGLAGMEERLETLGSKPFKVAADYTALREMKEELDIAKRAIAEWEALKASRTSTQEESKKILDEGIKEGGGAKAVEDSIIEIKKRRGTYGAGSTIPGQIAAARAREANARQVSASARKNLGEWAAAPSDYLADQARAEAAKLGDDLDKEARQKIASTVASASRSPAALKELGDYYKANPDVFKKHGVTDTFGTALGEASPEAIEKNRKIDEDYDLAIHNTDVSILGVKNRFQTLRGDAKKADAAKKKKAGERAEEIRGEATRVGPGFDEALEQALLARVASGQGVGMASGPLTNQLDKRLAGRGVPEDIRGEVADTVMDKVREKVSNQIQEEAAKRGISEQQAAGRLRQVAQDKFGAGEMTDRRRADAPRRQGQQQEAAQQRASMAHLKTQALMESMLDGAGPAMQELSRIEANNHRLQTKVRALGGFNKRPAMRMRSFVPDFGG